MLPLIVNLFGVRKDVPQPQEFTYTVRSSALRIERRTRPQPNRVPKRIVQPQPRPVVARAKPQPRPVHPPPKMRHEIARISPHARTYVPRQTTKSIDVEQQQAMFEKTIAQLRRQDNPVLSAARPVGTPAAAKPYTFDFAGTFGGPHAEGVLTPVKSWRDGPYDYYYVAYSVQYADGTTETGYVPWPIRYLPQDDPFLQHWKHFPLPVPLPGFQLPAGTDLHPLVAFCLEHRNELSDCPIEHD